MSRLPGRKLLLALAAAAVGSSASAQTPPAASSAVAPPAPAVPLSSYISAETREAFRKAATAAPQPNFGADVAAMRKWNGIQESQRLKDAQRIFAVRTARTTMGGVPVDVIVPANGIAPRNRERVLISLHGGGFMWGAGAGAVAEAIPVAGTGRIKVVSVDYRMAPEQKFPAASEDVAAVYRELLRHYRPSNIGIYGCSAGGILTAESVAWFASHGLPRPGAIATMCGTGAEVDGDSGYVAAILAGQPIPPGGKPLHLMDLPYFAGADSSNPLVFPINSQAVLAKFPPTLLLSGNRDFSASSLTMMQRKLHAAGVEAELYQFDGMLHAFMMDPMLPESRETYGIIWDFFDRHLGRAPVR